MSIIFGICNSEREQVDEHSLAVLAYATERYAPDGTFLHVNGRIGMGFQPYHTHQRSNMETQPLVNEHGDMLAFDGRLDNYAELAGQLNLDLNDTQDSSIVFAAFARWNTNCFSRFVGDWALALWTQVDRSLYVARDHAGTRTLYYAISGDKLLWSTSLETILYAGPEQELESAYVLRYLASQPIRDLTPYRGVKGVLPAHFLKIQENRCTQEAHWSALVGEQVCYRTDEEYDDHFLCLFRQAVERRTGPGAPILAHLSGGMDSTSIVCVSDHLRRQGGAQATELLDTLSIYDGSEGNWDDTSYFPLVESQRKKIGIHFDASRYPRTMEPVDHAEATYVFPGADSSTLQRELGMSRAFAGRGYRVMLSGSGGDEVLGGVPTGLPELSDYFVRGKLSQLLRQAFGWSLAHSTPLVHTLRDTASYTFHIYQGREPGRRPSPPWILKSGAEINTEVPFGAASLSVHSPAMLSNAWTWWAMQETLPHLFPEFLSRLEYRYPYLDRDLIHYLLRVPRSKLVSPTRRRLLMRRALKGIVPQEVLERRRKAYVIRKVFTSLNTVAAKGEWLIKKSPLAEYGYIDPIAFLKVLGQAIRGVDVTWALSLLKTAELSLWLLNNHCRSFSSYAPSRMELQVSETARFASARHSDISTTKGHSP